MKLIILISIVIFGCVPCLTQTKPENVKPKTELESFQETYGNVVIKGFSKIGMVRGIGGTVSIQVMELRSASSKTKVKGLVVQVETTDRYSNTARSFIEAAEIDSLIKGIEYISKIDKTSTTLDNFEARYRTKGDFEITIFNSNDGSLSVALSVGNFGAKQIFLDLRSLPEISELLQKAKSMIVDLN